jgi:TniQ
MVRFCQPYQVSTRWLLEHLDLLHAFQGDPETSNLSFQNLSTVSGQRESRLLEAYLPMRVSRGQGVDAFQYMVRGLVSQDTSTRFVLCPHCLTEDLAPFIRLVWCLKLVCICPVHRTVLLEMCPACGKYFGLNLMRNDSSTYCCWNCGFDCRNATVLRSGLPDRTVQFQQVLLGLPGDSDLYIHGIGWVSGRVFLRMLERLFFRLSNSAIFQAISSMPADQLFPTTDLLDDRFSSVFRRVNILTFCAWFLESPLERRQQFVSLTRRATQYDPNGVLALLGRSLTAAVDSLSGARLQELEV